MSLSLENVLDLLNITPEVGDQDSVDPRRFSDFQGPFRDDLESRILHYANKGRMFAFDHLMFYKFEIGDLNGKQVLRMLISLTNNEQLMKDGNCFVFLVNNEPDTSLTVFYSYCWCEPRSVLAESDEDKGRHARAFDDKTCSRRQKIPEFVGYDSQTLEQFRSTLSKQYEIYMQQKIVDLEPKYRRLFFGIVFEIAKCHVRHWKVYKHLKNFPTSSLIKLALDNRSSGKLQAVFNDHNLDISSIMRQTRNRQEQIARVHSEKAKLRLEGAKVIIDKIFPPNAEGKYNDKKVRQVAHEITRFCG